MSKERVEQAERIEAQYKEELDRKREELEAHKNFRDGQPSTQSEIDEHVRKQQQLEAQVAKAEQQYKEAQAQHAAEKARQDQVEAEQRRAEEEMKRNGYGSDKDRESREEQEQRANEEKNAGGRPRRNGIGSVSAIRQNRLSTNLRPMTVTSIMIPTVTMMSRIMTTAGGLRPMTGTGIGEQKVFNLTKEKKDE